ncbi:MAG: chromosome partitioning protein ParB, partial [Planctomycetaceae bacterium]|nr:chromosome partitioning protein ParB [Planctomycetaceae bacterium]
MEDQNQNPEDPQVDPTETPGAPRRRLGRGLNALLGRGADSDSDQQGDGQAPEGQEVFVPAEQDQIDIDLIERNPYQPRQDFAADS